MSDHEKPAMSEDDIETMAWELETKMMEIRKDPRAALTAGLAKIRTTMLAEYKADVAKMRAEYKADMAKMLAEFAALKAARTATFEAEFAALTADLCGACAENLRQRAVDAAKAAERDAALQ
jgi:hypothetical protein